MENRRKNSFEIQEVKSNVETTSRLNKNQNTDKEERKSAKSSSRGVCTCTTAMKDIILALVTRALFAAHGLVGIWRAQTEWNRLELWLLLIPVAVLMLEALFTVGIRGGEEYKWVSPCVVLYLCGIVPSIWLLELKNFELRLGRHYCSDLYWANPKPGCDTTFNSFTYDDIPSLIANETRLKDACEAEFEYIHSRNRTNITTTPSTSVPTLITNDEQATIASDNALNDAINKLDQGKELIDQLLGGLDIFNETTWVLVLHQLLIFILIIGRWLLPTGEGISRDELSQLLLVFIGVGADILEFVTETVKEISVRCDVTLIICIMAFWSWSTLQFMLVLTAAKARRVRAAGIYGEESGSRVQSPVVVDVEEEEKKGKCRQFFSNMEVWGIMSTLILQDGPFLAMRLYIMIGKNVVHQMIVFFTCKNLLVVILQAYRLIIIATSKNDDEEEEDEVKPVQTMKAMNKVAIAKNKFSQVLKKKNETDSESKGKRSPKIAPAAAAEASATKSSTQLPGA